MQTFFHKAPVNDELVNCTQLLDFFLPLDLTTYNNFHMIIDKNWELVTTNSFNGKEHIESLQHCSHLTIS